MEEIAIDAVGLDETVQDFERSVLESTGSYQEVQIVGIVGPGGAGKTTLAKELYEKKCPMVKRSVFLSHLRSTTAENALINLQKKLVRDLLPDSCVRDLPIRSIDDGKIIVASYLKYVRVLLVLDDVDRVDQLEALLPGKGNLASGSLVIVPSRRSSLLTSCGISSIYKMKGLDPLHAGQLLCKHAFLYLSPPDGYKTLVERFVSVCDRLPLTLKLLGHLLQEKPQEYWQSQLQKVSKILPVDTKIILDHILFTLSEEELGVFIDIACFFIGEKKSLAIAAWDGLGWNGMHCWETLVKKCLVELDEKKRVRMHCELRDFAKEIAINRFPYRLWSPEQVVDIQEAKKSNYHKLPFMLRELIISSCWGSNFASFPPSISKLRYLRKIALIGCIGDEFRLQGLPDEFCSLQSLEHLELRYCKALSSLPTQFGYLRNLQFLDLCCCEALSTLPFSFRYLFNLQYLDLSGCRKLAFRPHILEYFISLESLYLSGCFKLQKLPDIKNQVFLKQLHLQDTNLLQLPTNIDQLRNLRVLTVGSPLLTSLPNSLGCVSSLSSLSIIDCIDMEALPPSLEHLSLLECLYIKSSQVKSLPIWQFANLKTLKICDCPIEKLDFGQGHSMKKLNLLNISQTLVASISISEDCCPMLEILQLEQNDNLLRIEVLPTTVKIIELSDCELLNDISGVNSLVNLRFFNKSGCPQLEKL